MSGQYFVEQVATADILRQVTRVCAECYSDIEIDDKIYYDMQKYRYLCSSCHQDIVKMIEIEVERIDDEGGLFA
jgi:hypothetical protein